MTYPVGPNNQIYYKGEFQDKLKSTNLKDKAPKAGVADTAMSAAAEPMVSLKNVALGTAGVAALDFLMNLGLRGDKNSLLVKLVNKIENTKWAQNQRALKADALLDNPTIKNNRVLKSLKRKAWIQHQADRLLGNAKGAFKKGASAKSIGMKMPAAHTYLDIEHVKAMKDGGKGLEGSLKTQRDLIKRVDKVIKYKDVTLKNGKVIKVAIKESTGISRGISKFFVGVKHFIGNAIGGSSGEKMSLLKKMGGGSLFGYVMNGVFIGMSIQEAKHAPKGERKKAFMEDFIGNWIFGFACWPMISRFVNKLTGFGNTANMAKNLIKGDKALEASAQKFHFLDQIIKTGKYNDKAKITPELKKELDTIVASKNPQRVAKKALKPLRKVLFKKLPFKQKLFNRLGRIVSMGRTHTWANVKNAQGLRKVGKFMNFAFKRIPGGAFRMMALVGTLTLPFAFVGKKISHLIFGKPNIPKEDHDKQLQNPNYDKAKVDARIQDLLSQHSIQSTSENNFQRAIKEQTISRPASKTSIAKAQVEPQEIKKSKYIPSSAPVVVDNSSISDETAELLDKTGRYEKYASEMLEDI